MKSKGIKKVPVIMQMETVECGAAALSMLLAYYGKWLSLEQLRADCGISRDGSNARNLVLAARKYGLDAHGWHADIDDLGQMSPAIIHWNFNHFVVLCGFSQGFLKDFTKPLAKTIQMVYYICVGVLRGIALMYLNRGVSL